MNDIEQVDADQLARDADAAGQLRRWLAALREDRITASRGELRQLLADVLESVATVWRVSNDMLTDDGPESWSRGYRRGVATVAFSVGDQLRWAEDADGAGCGIVFDSQRWS